MDRLIEEIHTDHGEVDVLVNNAGLGSSSHLEQVALSDLRSIFETNVVAMLHLSQAVLPGMRTRGAGTIVNIGSTAGRWTSPGPGAYHTSKAQMRLVTVDADTVARAVVRAVEAETPQAPLYRWGVQKGLPARSTAADRPDVGSALDEGPRHLAPNIAALQAEQRQSVETNR